MKSDTPSEGAFFAFVFDLLEEDVRTREIARFWRYLLQESVGESRLRFVHSLARSEKEQLVSKYVQALLARDDESKLVADNSVVDSIIASSTDIMETGEGRRISRELLPALKALGMFLEHKGLYFVENLANFSYALALALFERQMVRSVLAREDVPPDVLEVVAKIQRTLEAAYGPIGNLRLFAQEAANHVERRYGLSSIPIRSLGVYQRGFDFYRAAEFTRSRLTITASNTSGLFNPLERMGTEPFLARIGLREGAGPLPLKHSLRSTNFDDGIINPNIDCCRIYIWNEARTFDAFRDAWEKARDKEAFVADVKEYLAQMEFLAGEGKLICCQVPSFEEAPALSYLTRLSENTMMWSNRNSKSEITHAFWFNLRPEFDVDRARTRDSMGLLGLNAVLAILADFAELPLAYQLGVVIVGVATSLYHIKRVPAAWARLARDVRRYGGDPREFLRVLQDSLEANVEEVTMSDLRDRLISLMEVANL